MFNINRRKKIIELEARKETLIAKNSELKKKISETREYTAWYDETWKASFNEAGYAGRRGGSYGAIKNLSDFEKWKQTSFWKYQKELNRQGSVLINLHKDDDAIRELFLSSRRPEYVFLVCAYCDMVLPTSNGPIIHIMDPYGEYTFPPAKSISNSEANNMVGFIVKFTCVMKYCQNDYEILDYEMLPYTLHEKQEVNAV